MTTTARRKLIARLKPTQRDIIVSQITLWVLVGIKYLVEALSLNW